MSFVRPEIIRPPSEHDSYYLALTSGCSNNSCTFCNFSFSNLGIRDLEDVKQEIDAMSLYVNSRMLMPGQPRIVYCILQDWDGRKVFLQDGDALVYPYPKLLEALQYLNQKFPNIQRIASYATPQDILRRTVAELKALKEQKLGILYMGVESGDDEVLRRIQKNATHDQMVEAAGKVKEAGILLSATVILGLGGVKGSAKHVSETARILTEMDPDYAGALTLTLIPGTALYKEWERGEFELITPFDSLRELKGLVENSTFTNCFFSSMHASNYFAIRGSMPQDRDKILKQLNALLSRKDPHMLRPEYMRGL
ncbi:MAG: radical SAM protein [Candidatus Moduliflexus flocculans]|nr:radical SAM protein [Candidatus Moduliflexus flocculans]